jgi:hypothetical protein
VGPADQAPGVTAIGPHQNDRGEPLAEQGQQSVGPVGDTPP